MVELSQKSIFSELIRISDNGGGIPANEVELAFQRFATSKVSSAEDLDGIKTLGFRGEALPSISAVSRVTLVTRCERELEGTRFEVHDGETVGKEPTGAPTGTTITVRQLFRNLPARQKFLKTVGTEMSRIQIAVTRYALAYPEVRFELNPDKGRKFASPGTGDLRAVVAAVYGLQNAEGMLRGLDTCEKNAKDRGHTELDGYIWSYYYKRNDTKFLIVCDDAYFAKAVAMSRNEKPEPVVVSLVEIFRLIPRDNWIFILNMKKEFPGSEVIEPTPQEEIDNMGPVSSFSA